MSQCAGLDSPLPKNGRTGIPPCQKWQDCRIISNDITPALESIEPPPSCPFRVRLTASFFKRGSTQCTPLYRRGWLSVQ